MTRCCRGLLLVFGVSIAIGVAAPLAARAQDETGWGYELANELMSPWCPGFSLPDCSSGYAAELRLWILEQERLGRSEADVKAEILAKYGEQMLQAPSAKGRGILAYAIPAVVIVAGGIALAVFLRRQVLPANGVRTPSGGSDVPDPLLLSRVDAEISAYEGDDSSR